MELPHRFVPTASRIVHAQSIRAQNGHAAEICALSFSGDNRILASADRQGWLRLWSLDTLDILGIYLLDFCAEHLEWDGLYAITARGAGRSRTMILDESGEHAPELDDVSSRMIRLLDAPEVHSEGDCVEISCNGMTFTHEVPGLMACHLEPYERYVVAYNRACIFVFSVFEEAPLLQIPAPDPQAWIALNIRSRGDYFTAISDRGTVFLGDAQKKTFECIYRGDTPVSVVGFGGDTLVALGDCKGNILVYDPQERVLILRTPRQALGFVAEYPSPEQTGYVALRPESATAFFGSSREILTSSPLPAPVQASCAGSQFSEFLAACTDHNVYRIKLDSNNVTRIAHSPRGIAHMASNQDHICVVFDDGTSAMVEGTKLVDLPWQARGTLRGLAVSENGKTIAALFEDRVELFSSTGKKPARSLEVSGGAALIFGKEKTTNSLLLFMRDLRMMHIDVCTDTLADFGCLELDHGRVLSTAPAAKSFAYVLCAGEHGQRVVLRVGLNSGKSGVILRVMPNGTQIFAASTDETSTRFRQDATCLRIVSGLQAYSIEDWTRSEGL